MFTEIINIFVKYLTIYHTLRIISILHLQLSQQSVKIIIIITTATCNSSSKKQQLAFVAFGKKSDFNTSRHV